MSKIFLLSDTHIGLGYPNKTDKWFKIHKEYFSDFLIPLLKERVENDDIIVHLGDLFDNRNVIPINLLNYAIDIVEEISNIAPMHIIVGNHDLWSKSTSEINTIRPFRYMPNVFIYDRVSRLEYNGIKICMMPFVESRLEQIKQINEFKDCDYLFCHSDLNGCKMHLTSIAHKNSDKIDIDNFKYFRKVRSGHIHIVQENKHFTFIGSPFQMDRNDYNNQKGIFILNTDDDSEEFIPNNISPIFKKVEILSESDIVTLESLKNTKDFIDITISNNLLVNNRRLRRKLENILENGSFESIEYIDDIKTIDDVDTTDEIVMENQQSLDISIQLDYEEYIKEYIQKQYENSNIKDGLLEQYDEIITIFKDNYK